MSWPTEIRNSLGKMTTSFLIGISFVLLNLISGQLSGQQNQVQRGIEINVAREMAAAVDLIPNFKLLDLAGQSGKLVLEKSDGVTVEDLRGLQLDQRPPSLSRRVSYDRRDRDLVPTGMLPYVAKGIRPFRLNHFNCEFNYGGRHNYPMQDYASLHGFNMIYPFRRNQVQQNVFPAGTRITNWRGIDLYRRKWFKDNRIPNRRYDLLTGVHFQQPSPLGNPQSNQRLSHLMLDMEHVVLDQTKLKKQKWYPKLNTNQFESKYYNGYAATLIATARAHRLAGFKSIGIYGWQPFDRSWVPMLRNETLSRHGWETYGKSVYNNVDVIHCSVYCPYYDARNVAYVLATIDENVKRVDEMSVKKPVRPYFWPLVSGGGGGSRWWKEIPHPNEDQQAMIAMSFFTGIDGLVIWNWSGTSNHHQPDFRSFDGKGEKPSRSLMVGKPFRMAKSDGSFEVFRRYNCLHVDNYTNGVLNFQKIYPGEKSNNYGISPDREFFNANFAGIKPYLRPRSEPVAAIVEALALIKPFEYSIRTGTPKQDSNGVDDFRRTRPLLRRVENGKYHLVITYNPNTIRSGKDAKIEVKNFAGHRGLNLVFPADQNPRIFVVADK